MSMPRTAVRPTPRCPPAGIVLALAALLAAPALSAQDTPVGASPEPRVGLVLGGGGARGFAHVGVLKVLEELRVPVVSIAGTSMGSIIGGMYAQGYSAAEIERIVLDEDWAGIFAAGGARSGLPMRRKREERELGIGVSVGISGDGVVLPSALVTDERLNNALSAHTARVRHISDFDRLPIPYRAVATDVDDGSVVVLDEGSLATALRASMAVPGVFAPVEFGGRRLVDGGLVRNVPVDVGRSMGAEELVVVDVSTQLADAPTGGDALSMLLRTTTIYSTVATAASLDALGEDDVFVRPDLTGHPGTDFTAAAEVMALGEAAARERVDELRRFSVSEEEWVRWRERVSSAAPPSGPVRVAAVRVDSTHTALSPRMVRARTGIEPGDTLSLVELRGEMDALVGRAALRNAAFSLRPGPDGADTVVVTPRDPGLGMLTLRTGLSLYDRGRGASRWNLRARLGTERMTRRGGEGWAEVEIGTRRSIGAWIHLPLHDSEQFFLTAEAGLSTEGVVPGRDTFLPVDFELRERGARAGIGLRIGGWGEATAELAAARVQLSLDGGVGGARAAETSHDRAFEVRIEGDVLDRSAFPSSGHRLDVRYRRGEWRPEVDPDLSYDLVRVDGSVALSSGHHTLRLNALWSALPRLADDADVPVHLAEPLGGADRLAGAAHHDVWGGFAAFAKVEWGYRLGAMARDGGSAGTHLGLSVEAGEAALTRELWRQRRDSPQVGATMRVGRATPLGPVTVAWSVLRDARPVWSVRIGPEF